MKPWLNATENYEIAEHCGEIAASFNETVAQRHGERPYVVAGCSDSGAASMKPWLNATENEAPSAEEASCRPRFNETVAQRHGEPRDRPAL